jgi:2-dehydropantoate 2-reductase
MDGQRIAVVGVGAAGAVLAASLLKHNPGTVLVDPRPGLEQAIKENGISISGEMDLHVPVRNFLDRIEKLKDYDPEVILVSTKTFQFPGVLEELAKVLRPGMKIVSTHNGLGTEDLIVERFGAEAAFRMTLNFGVSLKRPSHVEMAFFNRPNYLGALIAQNKETGLKIAERISAGGLDTEYVDDIKYYVWKKMITKCTMASICAVTDKTIKDALAFAPTREIAEGCFNEILAVAKAKGYDIGQDFLKQVLAYLEKAGIHKDSMCVDIANKTRTEIDFLGMKVVEYGKKMGVPTPFYIAMTNLVRTIEDGYLNH